MATRVFADEELRRLREFPEINREELFRFFTLTPTDTALVAPRGRRVAGRLYMAVVLWTLPWLGFVPDKVSAAPPVAVARLAERLSVVLYAHEGMIRARHLEAQTEQTWCLTLATNAVIAWTTE